MYYESAYAFEVLPEFEKTFCLPEAYSICKDDTLLMPFTYVDQPYLVEKCNGAQ